MVYSKFYNFFIHIMLKQYTFNRRSIKLCTSELNPSLFLIYATDMALEYFSITYFYGLMNFPNLIATVVQLPLWIIRKKVPLPLEHIVFIRTNGLKSNPQDDFQPHLSSCPSAHMQWSTCPTIRGGPVHCMSFCSKSEVIFFS